MTKFNSDKIVSDILALGGRVKDAHEKREKPLDKLFDDMDNLKDKFFKDMDKALPKEVTYISRLEQEVKQLKDIVKGYRFENATLKEENFQLKEELETADDILTIQREEIEISRLPLNERIEQEYINKRENEDLSKEINQECKQEKGREVE